MNYHQGREQAGLGLNCIHHGGNSGYQAINLAFLFGAATIVLLGYDMSAKNGQHFFGSHPQGLTNGNYESFVTRFDQLAKDLRREGVEVINATPDSALTQFKKEDWRCVL